MLDGASAAERTVVADIAIERLRFEGGGRPLLYLHPKDGPAADTPFLAALAEAGFDVHAPWLPGFGMSDRPAGVTRVGDLASFALEYLEAFDLRDTLVVGASFGGWVAAEMATRDLARIGGLVLIDALGVKFAGRDQRDIADFHSLPPAELQRLEWAAPAAAPPPPADKDAGLAAARSEEAFALYGWKPYMHDPGLPRWLRRARVPALVLWGAADGVVSPAYGKAYAALLPDARFETIPGAAHYPTRERAAETARRIATAQF